MGVGPRVLLSSSQIDMRYLLPSFARLAPAVEVMLEAEWSAADHPCAIDAVICWYPTPGLFDRLGALRLVHSIAAGVDHILAEPSLGPDLPVCRIIDPDMASGMVAYVVWAIIYRHRHFDAYLAQAAEAVWQESPVVPTRLHRIGILGLGVLGIAVARALVALGYDVAGWSRSAKTDLPTGVEGFHGEVGLDDFLAGSQSLVCLLPLTAETTGFLSRRLFQRLPRGAHLINVGRGGHLVEEDLLAALDAGELGAATLDALVPEPLPADHPFWRHPSILVTPHIATRTLPDVVVRQFLANLQALETGAPMVGLVDRRRGY